MLGGMRWARESYNCEEAIIIVTFSLMVPKLHSCICGRIWEMGRTTWSILCQEESHILSTVEMPHKWLSRVTYFKSAYRCMFFSLACAKWSDLSHLGQLRQTCQGRSKQVCVCLGPDQGCWFKVCSDTDSCYERLLWHWNVLVGEELLY